MKTLAIVLIFAFMPFLLIWAAFLLTGFSFNPISVFQKGDFWGFSIMYWFIYICFCPFIPEMVDEFETKKS
jgi:hypothetical protein